MMKVVINLVLPKKFQAIIPLSVVQCMFGEIVYGDVVYDQCPYIFAYSVHHVVCTFTCMQWNLANKWLEQ